MHNVFIIWAVMGIVCGVLAIIPFLFWDLDEEKQLQMAKEIKIRTYQEEIESGGLDPSHVEEAVALGIITADEATRIAGGGAAAEAAAAEVTPKDSE